MLADPAKRQELIAFLPRVKIRIQSDVMKTVLVVLGSIALLLPIAAAEKKMMTVKILDRQNHDTLYTYFVPGYSTTNENSSANCFGTDSTVNCSGSARATTTSMPAHGGSFSVKGATFALQLDDGRVAVVNCDSKFAEHMAGPAGNHRSCRTPLVDEDSSGVFRRQRQADLAGKHRREEDAIRDVQDFRSAR